jgi:hypothetical protein
VAYSGFGSVFSLLLAFVSILGFAFRSDPFFQNQVRDSTLRLMPVIGRQTSGHIGSPTGRTLALVVEPARHQDPRRTRTTSPDRLIRSEGLPAHGEHLQRRRH